MLLFEGTWKKKAGPQQVKFIGSTRIIRLYRKMQGEGDMKKSG